jgi:6-phosphofructokinase
MTRRSGIPTEGGDCGGVNAVSRTVTVRATRAYVWEVAGIRNGPIGVSRDPARPGAAGAGRGDG